jgi:TBC1 domain family member 24
MASLVAAKDKVFINQTKLLHEVTWKTVMQIAKKHAKNAVLYLQRMCDNQKSERIFIDWCWWILGALPFPHLGELRCADVACDMKHFFKQYFSVLVRVMDCFFNEGIKVLYRVALAILILFHKHTTQNSSDWSSDSIKNDIDNAIPKFCKQIPVSPLKLMRTAFNIRALR